MVQHLIIGVELDRCTQCRGIWADSTELASVTGTRDDLRNTFPEASPTDFRCPRECNGTLEEISYSNVDKSLLIDRCNRCGGVYLDAGELEKVSEINQRIQTLFGDGTFESGGDTNRADSRRIAGFFRRLFRG